MCEATLQDELNTFHAHFDLLNKDSAVKSTLPPKDQLLSVTTADVSKLLLRMNTHEAVGPDNILIILVLKTCADQLADVITTFLTSHSHRRLFAPAPMLPSSFLYLKGLCHMALTPS